MFRHSFAVAFTADVLSGGRDQALVRRVNTTEAVEPAPLERALKL
jgi:hypothetical protein